MNEATHYPVEDVYREVGAVESTISDPEVARVFRTRMLKELSSVQRVRTAPDLPDAFTMTVVDQIWKKVDALLAELDLADGNPI